MEKSKIPLSFAQKTPSVIPVPCSKILGSKTINRPRDDFTIQRPVRTILKRRSKSYTDLRSMDVTPLTDLHSKFNRVVQLPSTSKTSTKPVTMRVPQSTKSCTDLPSIGMITSLKTKSNSVLKLDEKPSTFKLNLKTIPEKAVSTVKTGTKRPAVPAIPPQQAKVSRPAKIPAYDYKARYNLQVEKYKMLQSVLQEKELELTNASVLKEENETFLRDIGKLRTDYNNVNDMYVSCKKELVDNLQVNKCLEESLSSVQVNFSNLKSEHQTLLSLYNTLKEKLEDVNTEIKSLKEDKEGLNTKLEEVLMENKTLRETLEVCQASVQEHENLRRIMHNQIQDLKGNVRIFCRVRPPQLSENDKIQCNFKYIDEDTLEIKKTKENLNYSGKLIESSLEFAFDKVFQPETSQIEVFEELSQLIQSAMDGYHVCVFAYGQTGSGKTYTMQGEDNNISAGMIPRSIDLIFKLIDKYQQIGWNYTVEASFLEIYNETIRDLLNPQNKEHLEIRFNEGKGTSVTNLTTKLVRSSDELRYLMSCSNQNRAVAVTNYNEHSSRSHAVTKITLRGIHEEIQTVYTGSLSLVDLAGSESAKTSTSERITETKNINKSLSALGSVMTALQNKENHIPYRNSKLTYLLQSSLGGNSKTLMFVNIAPFEECYGESVNALRFASKVKEVKLISKKNKSTIKP